MLFSLNRNTRFKRFLNWSKDIHAHLIPGIDDGPETMEESLLIIENLGNLGYKELTATPHVFHDYYPNTKEDILAKLGVLQREVEKADISVKINSGAEYFLDYHFESLLESSSLLTVFDNFILVEMSTFESPPYLYDILEKIKEKGYRPILAHPERYLFLGERDYLKLLQFGCTFQLNILSISTFYGREIQKRAIFLLKKNWVHYLGTDIHKKEQLAFLEPLIQTNLDQSALHRFLQ